MLHTMKQAKMKPCGRCSPRGDSAGVHKKTKVYMEPSKRLCIAPSSAILGSADSKEGWSHTRPGMLCMPLRYWGSLAARQAGVGLCQAGSATRPETPQVRLIDLNSDTKMCKLRHRWQ